jgi:prophage regulatory protein
MTDRIVRAKEARTLVGISRTTIHELEKRGNFPRRVELTGGRVGWRLSELQQWIESRRPVGHEAA